MTNYEEKSFCDWCLEILQRVTDVLLAVVGPIFVLLGSILITAIILVHFFAIIPYYGPYLSLGGLLHLIISITLSFNIYFNYIATIRTSPGYSSDIQLYTPEEQERLKNEPAPKRGEGWSKYCKTCKKAKVARCHHCHICKKCILRMDHHCPWVNNCVGMFNHRYFFLFVLYLWLGCSYVATMSFYPFVNFKTFTIPWDIIPDRGTIIFTFIITFSISMALSILGSWHFYLIISGQTTIEFYFNRSKKSVARSRGEVWHNPYDLGTKKNWQLFFGTEYSSYWFSWLLPTNKKVPGDGCYFPTRYSKSNNNEGHNNNNLHFV